MVSTRIHSRRAREARGGDLVTFVPRRLLAGVTILGLTAAGGCASEATSTDGAATSAEPRVTGTVEPASTAANEATGTAAVPPPSSPPVADTSSAMSEPEPVVKKVSRVRPKARDVSSGEEGTDPETTDPQTVDSETTDGAAETTTTTTPDETVQTTDDGQVGTTQETGTTHDTGTNDDESSEPGTVDETVAVEQQATIPAVPLEASSHVGGRITADVTSIDRISAEARLPGEVAGPALAVHVGLENDSSRQLDVGGVTVTLEDADGTPSVSLSSAPAEPFSGTIEPGESAEAVYVFAFEHSQSQPITVGINYSADEPVALFVGNV